ncbi:PIN domain-containing protein [candidate division KSB1 bacterium]|nr:PIN domain-containing protein [candidate division KSB1 bacterium]
MVLVDTSVWISHFRDSNAYLQTLLNQSDVMCHDIIIGELACGHLQNRKEILALLNSLPKARHVEHDEILYFIETNKLMGTGLGYIDMCLLASAALTDVLLWTIDKKLSVVSSWLGLQYVP